MTSLLNGPEKNEVVVQHEIHLRIAEAMKDMKKKEISEAAKSNGAKLVLFFLFIKDTSYSSVDNKYSSLQASIMVHDEVNNTCNMYVWGEHTASRRSQEIASCLLYHITNCLPQTTKEIILYSDSCGGQNRNIKMALVLSYILQKTDIKEIQQKFFSSWSQFLYL